jgi:acetyl-CoA acetyltransferase
LAHVNAAYKEFACLVRHQRAAWENRSARELQRTPIVRERMSSAAIAGVGETEYTRHPPRALRTERVLADAALRALRDAALEPHDIDGLAVASFTLRPDHAIDLAWKLGLRVRWLMEDTNGGAAGLNMLHHARSAIETGEASAILILGGDVFSAADFADLVNNYNAATRDYLAPLEYGGPNALFAFVTQRHMATHGLTRLDYAQVPLSQRAWAAGNPGAVYRLPLTMDDYLAAPIIADPLCRYDCVPVVAGANALVITSDTRADRPVRIRALRPSYNYDHQENDGLVTGLATVAGSLWEEAGVGPDEIDLACIYDDYPVMVLIQLTDLGFAPNGDVRKLVSERIASRRLPVNTSGGMLSAGQAGNGGALHGLVEATRQLRGEAGERQVDRAQYAVVTGYGMVVYRYCAGVSATVLERGW